MLLPDLSTLCSALIIGGPASPRIKRQRNQINYAELDDADDTPLVSSIERHELPGSLKISNKCFVEDEKNVRLIANGGLLVVVTDTPTTRDKKYGGADVVHCPFQDKEKEPDKTIKSAIKCAVDSVQQHWKEKPNTTVLVHCNAGQNRSAAVVLAVLRIYGVPENAAVQLVEGTQNNAKYMDEYVLRSWNGTDWNKFAGNNGARLRRLVLSMYKESDSDEEDDDLPLSILAKRAQLQI